jgi:DNA-directed RNA polymerase specialized sigma24 family protein
MISDGTTMTSRAEYLATARPLLERAFVARFGVRDGMEAASDAIEYALANWERVSAMDNPTGYLFKVGHGKASRAIRRSRRMTALAAEPVTLDRPLDLDLQRALLSLPWEQRVAVVLVHAHGHSYASAAELLDIPITTITNHVQRGMTQLRKAVAR